MSITYFLMLFFVFVTSWLLVIGRMHTNTYFVWWRYIKNGNTRARLNNILAVLYAALATFFFHNVW